MAGAPRGRESKQRIRQERHVDIRHSDSLNVPPEIRQLRPWLICVGTERLRVSLAELRSLLAVIAPVVRQSCQAANPRIGGEEQD